MPDRTPLHELLYSSTISNFGSDEHVQIAGLLRDARKLIVESEAAQCVRSLLDLDPWQIEKHLDVVERPSSPLWYEWKIKTRAGHGGNDDASTGCLVVPHPASEDLLLVVTGWTNGLSDTARHAYGIALIGTTQMAAIASNARKTRKRGREESFDRILSGIEATIPSGFRDEIMILSDDDPNAIEGAFRDATAEIPYLLALLVSLKCRGGLVEVERDGCLYAMLDDPLKPSYVRGMRDRFLRRNASYITYERDGLHWYRG